MKKFRTYIAVLCTMLVAAACTNEMETTTATDVAQLVKIGGFPAFEENAQTRAIGTPDAGKIAWAANDVVLLKIQLKNGGTAEGTPLCYVLTYDGSTWKADKSLDITLKDYRNTADITAYYAPAYQWSTTSTGTLALKTGKTAGTDEYLVYNATGVSLTSGISIDFSQKTREYSRLRVVASKGETVTLTAAAFTTNGDKTATATDGITATDDDNGNAFFYGSWTANSTITFSFNAGKNNVAIDKAIAAVSTPNQSYAWRPTLMKFTVRVEAGSPVFNIPFPTSTKTPAKTTVYWGDGKIDAVEKGITLNANDDFNHTYAAAGTYQIIIVSDQEDKTSFQIPPFNFTNRADNDNKTKLISMDTPLLRYWENRFPNSFNGCTNLTTIPADLFANNTTAMNFTGYFNGCTNLKTIPDGLFDNNTGATNFTNCFNGCTGLATIPAGLFANNAAVTNFTSCFNGCTGLATIPAGLFDKNTKVTDFSMCFNGCTNLATIPDGLFANNAAVTNFTSCFNGCTGLKAIPTGLFDKNTVVTTFVRCFYNCTGLETIPEGLFANNAAVTDFSYCFSKCTILKLNEKIFIDATHPASTRFAGVSTAINFTQCFASCGRDLTSGAGGIAPALWNSNVYIFNVTPISDGCFQLCEKVTNASEITKDWGRME